MLKKIVTDWSLWVLIIFNLYLLDYYRQNPTEMATIIFLYWAQSVLIGFVNFFDMLTLPKSKTDMIAVNEKPEKGTIEGKGCMAFFFLFHYGAFHIAYLVFMLIKIDGKINFHFVQIGLAILACNLVIDFIRNKMQQRYQQVNVGKMFILPYARIVPMHLMIMLPEFFGVSNFTVFIILKIVMDLVMHFALSNHYRGGNSSASLSSEL
jgi:Family of unknown function (DUF6498)